MTQNFRGLRLFLSKSIFNEDQCFGAESGYARANGYLFILFIYFIYVMNHEVADKNIVPFTAL